MPIQNFPVGIIATATTGAIATTATRKNISKPGRLETQSLASIGKVVRVRSLSLEKGNLTSTLSGTMRRKLRFPAGVVATKTEGEVRFFLAVNPTAPPAATVYRASISTLISGGNAPSFAGSRIIRGDLQPIAFKVIGQKLNGLFATFTAKRKDDATAAPIIKTGSAIHLTQPVLDSKTGIETMMGALAIEPADTANFPLQEIELTYTLRLSDGIGRTYTVEYGSFTIFNC